jgi:hypothetical protein
VKKQAKLTMKFGRITSEKTPHRVGLSIEDVFADRHEEMAKWFTPLVAIDLGEIDPKWAGRVVHIVDFNDGVGDGNAIFKLSGNGKISLTHAWSCEPTEREGEIAKSYMAFHEVELPDLPERAAKARNLSLAGAEWNGELGRRIRSVHPDLNMSFSLGGLPRWRQASEDLGGTFVAQINTGARPFESFGTTMLLFYFPTESETVQVGQNS